MATTTWQALAAEKREIASKRIPDAWRLSESTLKQYHPASDKSVLTVPRECGILSDAELEITENYDATALIERLASGTLTATAVTTAFSKRAAIAQQLVNCLTETFFEEALERAKYLDEYLAREKRPLGPLHGLPISVKDSFKYKGYESTIGYVSFIGKPLPTEHSPLLRILHDLGAVLYVKTNIPQSLMTADSDNNIFGRTLNPHKLSLTAGGSSGGEGALIAMRGSLLGVGTDIAGSIRIPALCCGICGFKPTANRIPYSGQASPGADGSPGFPASAGPLATSFRDLELFTRHVLGQSPWNFDAQALPVPWRTVVPKKLLTIGVLAADPAFPLTPPVERALTTAANRLRAAGHIIVMLEGPSIKRANEICGDYFHLDQAQQTIKNILSSGEPFVPSVVTAYIPHRDSYTLEDLFKINTERSAYKEAWRAAFVDSKIDVLIGPGAETTAVPHDTYGNAPYTMFWNLLDYPSLMIPYLKADKTIDQEDSWPVDASRQYSAEAVDGAPTAVQVTARTFMDEELLASASVISEVLGSS